MGSEVILDHQHDRTQKILNGTVDDFVADPKKPTILFECTHGVIYFVSSIEKYKKLIQENKIVFTPKEIEKIIKLKQNKNYTQEKSFELIEKIIETKKVFPATRITEIKVS